MNQGAHQPASLAEGASPKFSEALSQKRWRAPEENTKHQLLASTCVHTCVPTPVHPRDHQPSLHSEILPTKQ